MFASQTSSNDLNAEFKSIKKRFTAIKLLRKRTWRAHSIKSSIQIMIMYGLRSQICEAKISLHFDDVILGSMASQITSLAIVYSTVYSGADQSKHQSSASLAFVRNTGDRWIPRTNGQSAENVSIWWRHYSERTNRLSWQRIHYFISYMTKLIN